MIKHGYFDIWLHEDAELGDIGGSVPAYAKTLREWPLSVVRRVVFENGTHMIYKAFRNLPTEASFYRTARSANIPELYYSHSEGDCHWLLLEDVAGAHPEYSGAPELLNLAARVRGAINDLSYIGPFRFDLSGDGYGRFARSTLELLKKLIDGRKLTEVDAGGAGRVGEALSHPEAYRAARGRRAFLHGDLKCDNVIVRPDGEITIIDWQNISRGPEMIDAYSLLATRAIDPTPVCGIGPEILRLALEMRWFADCLDRWMPAAGFLGGRIADIANAMAYVIENNGYAGGETYYFK